MAYEEETSK